MQFFDSEKIHNLLYEINLQSNQDNPSTPPFLDLADLCLSHENLRYLIKELLKELREESVDNKEIIQLAQKVVK